MVTGEDVSRWELYFQNLNTLLLGPGVRSEGKQEESKWEGEVTLFLNLGMDRNAGDNPSAVLFVTEPSSCP